MTKEEHAERHDELHGYLDELVADFIKHNGNKPSPILHTTSVMELMTWSANQIDNPTGDK